MNRKLLIGLLIIMGFFLNACQKNVDLFVPDPGQINGPDTSWYSSITPTMPVSSLNSNLLFNPYTDSIQVNGSNAYITTPFGLQCGFPPHCCVGSSGQVISGTVKVDLLFINKKGDIIRLGKPTSSNGRLLVSTGEIFLRFTQNNQVLQLAPNARIVYRYPEIMNATVPLKIFNGDESVPQHFNWLPNTDIVNNTATVAVPNIEIQTNHIAWLTAGYLYDTAGITRVSVAANLASNFTNANTTAWVVFKDFRSVVSMNAEIGARKFISDKLPVGKAITVVVISKQGNDYFLGFVNTVTGGTAAGTTTQLVNITPIKRSLADINYFLDTL